MHPVSIFGASCALPAKKADFPPPFSSYNFQLEPKTAYFSWAPLEGVLSTRTFYDDDTGLCRGIVLCYENGGSRAVGQCRLNVDNSVSVSRPTRLCYQNTTYLTPLRRWERPGVRVKFWASGDDSHQHDGEGWECLPLGGFLQLSFTYDTSYVTVEKTLRKEKVDVGQV